MCGGITDEDLAVTCGRDRAGLVVGPCPGADDGAVSDAARGLCGHAARRCRGSKVPMTIPRHRTDGAVLARFVLILRTAPAHGKRLLEGIPALLGEEVGRLLEGQPLPAAEFKGALADEHHVTGMLH